jgi:hypothetical protein
MASEYGGMGVFLGPFFLFFNLFAVSRFHIGALSHLCSRKPLTTSFALPQWGGGEPQTKLNEAYHEGEPSIGKSLINLALFTFLAVTTSYSYAVESFFILVPFMAYGFLLFISILFQTDTFVASDSASHFVY